MTSSEFVMWAVYLEDQWQEVTKEDYYLAQIALEVRRTKAKNPAALKLKHMLIQFASKTKKSTQETLQASKNYWMGLVDHKQRDD
jgi:hypothetical protein